MIKKSDLLFVREPEQVTRLIFFSKTQFSDLLGITRFLKLYRELLNAKLTKIFLNQFMPQIFRPNSEGNLNFQQTSFFFLFFFIG